MPTDDGFEADRRRARELLDGEGVDGLYAGVVRDDELDYVFAHRFDAPRQTGMRALSLLAQHVRAVADEAGLPPKQVADDAARLAAQLDDGRPVPGDREETPDGGEG